MNAKTIKILGIATAVAIVGAVGLNKLRDRSTAAGATDARLVPALEDRINQVRTIVIEGQEGTLTLNGGAAGWTLAEKGGYAANDEKARELLLGLRDARRIEEKTSNPERLGRLGLDAPDAEDSQSKRVTLKDESGETITTLLIGKRRFGKGSQPRIAGGSGPGEQYYVLPEAGGPSYLAAGKLMVNGRSSGWLDQQFLDVARERIMAIRIVHPDDEVVAAARSDMEAFEMEVIDVPEGKTAKSPSGTATFISALGRLRFDDVQQDGDIEWNTNPITRTEFYTEHGLTIIVESIELPKESDPEQKVVWARFRFDVAPEQAPVLPPEKEAEEEVEEVGPALPDEVAPDDTGDKDPAPTVAELETEARELNESIAGWTYALPSWKTTAFRARLDTLIEDVPEPEPAEEIAPAEEPAEEIEEPVIDATDDGARGEAAGNEGTTSGDETTGGGDTSGGNGGL